MSESSAESESSVNVWDIVRYVVVAAVAGFLIWYYFFHTPVVSIYRETAGKTMGTYYSVKVARFPENADWQKVTVAIQDRLNALEQMLFADRQDSEICRFNSFSSTDDWFPVSRETAYVVQTSLEISQLTEGAFDIVIAPQRDDQKLSVRLEPPALKKEIPELTIDLAVLAKGFAVDCVAELLDEHKLTDYLIEIGGAVRGKGMKRKDKDWTVGIEKPVLEPSGQFLGLQQKLALNDQSLATSGGPLQKDSVAAVLASDCIRADAWATAMFVLGEQKGMELAHRHGIAVLFLLRNGNEIVEVPSKNWGK